MAEESLGSVHGGAGYRQKKTVALVGSSGCTRRPRTGAAVGGCIRTRVPLSMVARTRPTCAANPPGASVPAADLRRQPAGGECAQDDEEDACLGPHGLLEFRPNEWRFSCEPRATRGSGNTKSYGPRGSSAGSAG